METGVARRPIVDMDGYAAQLAGRLDPVAGWLANIIAQVRNAPKRIIFAEGEQPQIARAANAFHNLGLGQPVLIGREEHVRGGLRQRPASSSPTPSRRTTPAATTAATSTPSSSTPACSARATCCATASASSTTTATSTPPAWWPWATPTAW